VTKELSVRVVRLEDGNKIRTRAEVSATAKGVSGQIIEEKLIFNEDTKTYTGTIKHHKEARVRVTVTPRSKDYSAHSGYYKENEEVVLKIKKPMGYIVFGPCNGFMRGCMEKRYNTSWPAFLDELSSFAYSMATESAYAGKFHDVSFFLSNNPHSGLEFLGNNGAVFNTPSFKEKSFENVEPSQILYTPCANVVQKISSKLAGYEFVENIDYRGVVVYVTGPSLVPVTHKTLASLGNLLNSEKVMLIVARFADPAFKKANYKYNDASLNLKYYEFDVDYCSSDKFYRDFDFVLHEIENKIK